jgi:hypothetical protein
MPNAAIASGDTPLGAVVLGVVVCAGGGDVTAGSGAVGAGPLGAAELELGWGGSPPPPEEHAPSVLDIRAIMTARLARAGGLLP